MSKLLSRLLNGAVPKNSARSSREKVRSPPPGGDDGDSSNIEVAPSSDNTVVACEAHAARDLASAALVPNGLRRRNLQLSAAHWLRRAELLGRLKRSFAKREALDDCRRQNVEKERM